MKNYKNRQWLSWLWLAATLFSAHAVHAAVTDISDIPMAVKNNVPPNFMYMMDTSGSMNNIVPDTPYSAKTTYLSEKRCTEAYWAPGYFKDPASPPTQNPTIYNVVISNTTSNNTNTTFRDDSGSSYTFGLTDKTKCFRPDRYYLFRLSANSGDSPKTPNGYLPAVYSGNYLNWYFGQASDYGSAASLDHASGRKLGTKTRIEVAKESAVTVMDNIPLKPASSKAKARVGLVTYNGENGGVLLRNIADFTSTHRSNMKSSIQNLNASGNTPLSETLADIGHYFTLGIPSGTTLTVHPDSSSEQKTVAEVFRQSSGRRVVAHTLASSGTASLPTDCSGTDCPIQNWCQRSYAFLMTDGRPNGDQALNSNKVLCDYDGDAGGPEKCANDGTNPWDRKIADSLTHAGHIGGAHSYELDGSDYLNDVAQALFEIDLRPDLKVEGRKKKNNVRTYTIGFADDQANNDPLLRETAAQGGGLFETADNSAQLIDAFNKVLNSAFAQNSAAAAVAVSNARLSVDNTAYTSSYESGFWTGDLQAFAINPTTAEPIEPATWSAKAKLDTRTAPATNRKIITYDGRSGVPFRAANINLSSGSVTLSTADNAKLIDYLRGDRSNEDDVTFRKRGSLLGDMINAEPVQIKYSAGPVLFQAANDGMLHVFNGCASAASCTVEGEPGEELWAYVPRMVHSKLYKTGGGYADPNYKHQYIVDATPAIVDTGTGTLLVGGLGKGGKGYYALDVSTYSASDEGQLAAKVKWEFPHSHPSVEGSVGYSYGTPLIVKSPSGWVVLVPSGHNNTDGTGKIFALDPNTGVVLHTIDTGVGDATNPAGLAHISKSSSAADADEIAYVYGGDLHGNVWRFDLSSWTAKKIAVLTDGSGNTQPVSTAPAVRGGGTNYMVYVGTGLYLGDQDVPGNAPVNRFATQTQSMYAIKDDTRIATPTLPNIRGSNGSTCPSNGGNGEFLCQDQGAPDANKNYTGNSLSMSPNHKGWYFDMPMANGRIVTHPSVVKPPGEDQEDALIFTINVPTNLECEPGGSSYFANVDARSGGAIPKETEPGHYPSIRFLANSLASRPVVVIRINEQGKAEVVALIRITKDENNDKGKLGGGDLRQPPVRFPPKCRPGTPGCGPKPCPSEDPTACKATPKSVPFRRLYWRELR